MAELRANTVRLNEGIQVQEAKLCILCTSEGISIYHGLRDRLFSALGTWSLMCCPTCELMWLNPRPIPKDIGKLYTSYPTHEAPIDSKRSLANLRKLVKASILKSSFGYSVDCANPLLGWALSRLGPLKDIVGGIVMYLKSSDGKRLLDVGCGNGQFLSHMRKLGWEVIGVDPDGKAVQIAREKFGLEVFHGTLEEAKFSKDGFDAITMNHVIEHVPDPIGLFKECRRVLKPGGKLVVVTPNIKSLGRRVFGQAWLLWDPPRHLFLFSPQSLKACVEQSDLIVQKLWTMAQGAHRVWVASRSIKRDGILPGGSPQRQNLWLELEGLAFQFIEYGMLRWNKSVGEEIVLIATKRKDL